VTPAQTALVRTRIGAAQCPFLPAKPNSTAHICSVCNHDLPNPPIAPQKIHLQHGIGLAGRGGRSGHNETYHIVEANKMEGLLAGAAQLCVLYQHQQQSMQEQAIH
jgi:hypothetical protein